MSRPTQVVCDGCGKQKQDNNHWWEVGVNLPYVAIVPLNIESSVLAGFKAFDYPNTRFDFCGQDCALKFISEQMGKVSQ